MPSFKVGILIGSLRKDSITKKMGEAVCKMGPPSLQFEIINIGELPIYNEDLETTPPHKEFSRFREKIKSVDAILFITPEYNRSVPAVLKNAVDVGSAPHGHNVFERKPAAIISLSPGKMGAFGANHHLRQSLVFLNMPTMQQPEVYIGGSSTLFDDNGLWADRSVKDYLIKFLQAFAVWIEKHQE